MVVSKEEQRRRYKEWYWRNKEELNRKQRERYQRNREHILEWQRAWCAAHREARQKSSRKHYRNLSEEQKRTRQLRENSRREAIKVEVLTHYGNGKLACVICGESRLDCLSIDHIEGQNYKIRRQVQSGAAFYGQLRRDGYLEGLQTLCMNCQFLKALEARRRRLIKSIGGE